MQVTQEPMRTTQLIKQAFAVNWNKGTQNRFFTNTAKIPQYLFAEIINGWKPSSIFTKSFIFDIWLGSEYVFKKYLQKCTSLEICGQCTIL